jgi:hypothetical protein
VRTRRFLLAAIVVVAVLAPGLGNATDACVSYSATAPVVGTKTGRNCAPTPFTHWITWYYCGGTPPIGEAHCVSVTVTTPF